MFAKLLFFCLLIIKKMKIKIVFANLNRVVIDTI